MNAFEEMIRRFRARYFTGMSPEGAHAMSITRKYWFPACMAIIAIALMIGCLDKVEKPASMQWLIHSTDGGQIVFAARTFTADPTLCAGIRIDGTAQLCGSVPREIISALLDADYFDLILDDLVPLDSTATAETAAVWSCSALPGIVISYSADEQSATVSGLPVEVEVNEVTEYKTVK